MTIIGIGAAVVIASNSSSCSTNTRINEARADMNARFGDLDAERQAGPAEIGGTIRRIDDRLWAVTHAVRIDHPAE